MALGAIGRPPRRQLASENRWRMWRTSWRKWRSGAPLDTAGYARTTEPLKRVWILDIIGVAKGMAKEAIASIAPAPLPSLEGRMSHPKKGENERKGL